MEWDIYTFARDLSTLNGLINRYEIPLIADKLYDLEGKLQHAEALNFFVQDIEFKLLESMAGTIPNEISEYSIFFTHNCCLDTNKNLQIQDPFVNGSGYTFIINILGYKENGSDKYYSTIRLDRHITGGGAPKVCHPFYHIQFGGDWVAQMHTGELMLTSSPRIAHPPMDLFLGIHFILDNFFNKNSYPEVRNLFQDEEYQSILIRAQKRLWVPYFQAFTLNTTHQDYKVENVFPLYILED